MKVNQRGDDYSSNVINYCNDLQVLLAILLNNSLFKSYYFIVYGEKSQFHQVRLTYKNNFHASFISHNIIITKIVSI